MALKIRDYVDQIRAYPQVVPVLSTSPSTEPALSIANDVIQIMLSQTLPWKFNRAAATPFLTVALQQDYITSITDLSWVEQGWRVDINNTANPKPIFSLEMVRDLQQVAWQQVPFQVSWIPNNLAIYGTWQANTSYPSGLGAAQTPVSPIQQFIDANGNFLFVSVNGISGNVQPVLPASSAAGTTVVDGTVTWKVADPSGIAFRTAPLPATSGIVWEMHPIYQKKPPIKTSLSQTISPIPDEFGYLFRQGLLAMCLKHAGNKNADREIQQWKEDLFNALRSSDRERDQTGLIPSDGLMSGGMGTYGGSGLPIGPSYPYAPFLF
jgi:hypothetical protein